LVHQAKSFYFLIINNFPLYAAKRGRGVAEGRGEGMATLRSSAIGAIPSPRHRFARHPSPPLRGGEGNNGRFYNNFINFLYFLNMAFVMIESDYFLSVNNFLNYEKKPVNPGA
jgi:hypothetical protein